MQNSGEKQESKNNYRARLDDILSTPLTAENIDSYANDAINSTIALIDDIEAAHKWDILANTRREAEDKILQEELDTNVSEILDHIYSVGKNIRSIDKYIDASRKAAENKVYVPPDTYIPNFEVGDGSFSEKALLPKAKTALFILKNDFEVDLSDPSQFTMRTGTVRSEMMRQTPYDLIEAPELNRTILSCDETGNRTFVFDTEKLKEAEITTDFLLDATKTELDQILEDYPKIGQALIYSKNYADRLKKILANIEEKEISINSEPKKANYLQNAELAPEGWYTIYGLSNKLGIAPQTISNSISDISAKEYKDSREYPRPYYSLEEVKNLPEIQKLLNASTAPEGWYTIYGLSNKLGIDRRTISNNISDISAKEYKDSCGHPSPHYSLEEVRNLPEIQKLIQKSINRKRGKKAANATM